MNIDPVYKVVVLDVLAYKKDRATVIGRPFLVLMLDPICGCVLNKTIEVTESPSDTLAGAMRSWRPAQHASTFVVDDGRDFRSTSLIDAAKRAGIQIQHRLRKTQSTVERAFMHIIPWTKTWQVGNEESTHLTLAEIQRRVSIKIANHNEEIRKVKQIRRPDPLYKVAGIGIPLSIRRAYYSVVQSSLECGFDTEQVSFIWQTSSYAYSAGQLHMMFEEIVGKFHSTKMYHDYYHTDVTHLQSLFQPPVNILEGEGAVAIRALARVKDHYDKKAFIWIDDFDWIRPIGSWADLTYALLEKLVKDGLATKSLRCKLLARDLGL
ncbi:hypothetical protein [Pseudomonas syringae]|uniref:hypothetical protein n=1 Tax=Pseudomonas syringae TaxID=317 RepID=UPI0002A798A4|nr:hypothetical protein [Pseudomonas syringae]ELP96362.1 hypothetical protein A979_22757 [Pseudomonas syringae BRIP34876]ELQ02812.1 hypothetical protein A987_11478 [Pseudomonas syringae BRIP34881]